MNSVHITISTVRPGCFRCVMETTVIVHCEPSAHLKIQGPSPTLFADRKLTLSPFLALFVMASYSPLMLQSRGEK